MLNKTKRLTMAVLALLLPLGVMAAEPGDIKVRVGASYVSPKSNNHDIVEVDGAAMLSFTGTYFMTEHWAVELLASLPFKHDIDLVGGGKVASTKHLPPTLSAQYHFAPWGTVHAYVGAGVNVTLFFQESTTGALNGTNLSLGTSVGPAAQFGIDVPMSNDWFFNAEVRYAMIETKAKLNGASLGDVEIDPWVFGINIGRNF